MKKILWTMLGMVYALVSVLILCIAIAFPFTLPGDENTWWIAIILYSVTLLICASQDEMFKFFDKKIMNDGE